MWNAILGKPRMLADGQVVTPCTFISDVGEKVRKELFGTDPASSALAAAASLSAATTFLAEFKAGEVKPPSPVVPVDPPSPPTPDPKAVAFQAAIEKVRRVQRAFDLGLVAQTALDNARAQAKALFLPEHMDLL